MQRKSWLVRAIPMVLGTLIVAALSGCGKQSGPSPQTSAPTRAAANAAANGSPGESGAAQPAAATSVQPAASGQPLLLLRYPTMSKTTIAFEYGGELWTVPRSGGQAQVLATGLDIPPGLGGSGAFSIKPIFSPNGQQIVFTGTFEHNTDVYVIPTAGGQPKRLTWWPGPDVAVGWTPDGKDVLFRSHRHGFSDPNQLYTVPATGGFPIGLPLSMAEEGSYSPDGSRIAFVPNFQWEPFWKGYKGGQHTQIWIAQLSDSATVRIPDLDANENDPMWVGSTIYFLSDRDGPMTLFGYDVKSGKVTRLIDNKGFDITSASAGPGGIVYSQFGQLHIYDYATGKTHPVPVTVEGDFPQRHPYFQNVAKDLSDPGISPHGVRAVFEAHGDILTVPAKDGSPINITHSPGAMDRDPAWSPDGKSIAYFSDRDGEYDLYIRPQAGGDARKVALGQNDAYYYQLTWSPDSQKLVFSDQKGNLWLVNLKAGMPKPIKVATAGFNNGFGNVSYNPAWSPDSRWLTFTESLRNYLSGVFVYSLADGKTHQLTDGASDAESPVFDADGKYLYFLASTDAGPSIGTDLATLAHPMTYHVYAVTLQANAASPIAPKAGLDEAPPSSGAAPTSAKPGGKHATPSTSVAIDFDGIDQRIVPLPIAPANYQALVAGTTGVLYLEKAPLVMLPTLAGPGGPAFDIERFTLKDKHTETLQQKVNAFVLAAGGDQMLYRQGEDWFIADATPKAKPAKLDTANLKVFVEPHAQWDEMYHEAWRIQRAFFYNPEFDGLDIDAAEKEFAHYLPGIASRDGLSYLFREMLSYEAVGHMFIVGGYTPRMEEVQVGLLGADYKVANDRYQITRIFGAGKWNPTLYGPLAQPGLKVKVGDYVLAVNGEPITADRSLYAYFNDLANRTVTLTVGPNPSLSGSHAITVNTIPSEARLRNAAWIEHNVETVNKLSDGKLGYIYLPDTEWGGFTNFNRYFFSQVDKQGVIVDERFNHGGLLSDYVIRYLTRKPMALAVTRWGEHTTAVIPTAMIPGPKVMVINQFSGSGGDALPWYFKLAKVGTLVGVRTWGGLVGIGGYPRLMDGGMVTAPRIAIEGLDGTFPVENRGIEPDVTVWQDPKLVREGRDPQLDRAVEIALQQLKAHPVPTYKQPPWRNYHPVLPPLPGSTSAVPPASR
ncbi:MAG TPA: PDZ domain-containing protein [Rhodanobacteraceae bacterium]|nr:PDZ domain-containing protein [Rhodanobacteraceae bacterium]